MLVKDYMSSHAITIRDNADYKSAFDIMEKNGIHHLPVINAREEVVGITTYRDLQVAARCHLETPVEIGDVMHHPVLTTQANDSLKHAAHIMSDKRYGCLPVLDDNQHVVGILTETDLFRALAELLDKPR
jgi:CBS domain-containing protein